MFRLYKKENSIFPFEEYRVLLHLVAWYSKDFVPQEMKVLEFGPGISTLAIIEAGIGEIHSCEYDAQWLETSKQMIATCAMGETYKLKLHPYRNESFISIPALDKMQFDMAFVDSPVGQGKRWVQHIGKEGYSRFNSTLFALERSSVVFLHDAKRAGEQRTLETLKEMGCQVTMFDTPKGIAVITK